MEINSSLTVQQTIVTLNNADSEKKPKQKVMEKINEIEKADVLRKKVDGVNDFLKTTGTHLKFQLHEELNEYYVSIIDEATKEIIKEVPPKKLLDMHFSILKTIGFFIDKKI